MTKFNILDIYKELESSEEQFASETPSDEEIAKDIPNQPSEKIADIVISFRYLGLYKNLSVTAMEELSRRRESGDEFQFEKYIENNLKSLPKLDFKLPDMDGILKSFGKYK